MLLLPAAMVITLDPRFGPVLVRWTPVSNNAVSEEWTVSGMLIATSESDMGIKSQPSVALLDNIL
jgi:hypothetical protein